MKIKYVIRIFILLLPIIGMTACMTPDKKHNPDIKTTFTVTKLTDDDFTSVGAATGSTKEDFRKVYFSIHVKQSKYLSNRKINVPDLKNIMNSYDMERYWYGKNMTWDNPTEDAEYTYDIMFYSKKLTDEDIKSIFKDSQIVISWINNKYIEESTSINLSDILVFN